MGTERTIYQLMTWLSPSYPVGAYSFSHGLEAAVEFGLVNDRSQASDWISDLLEFGNGQTDLVFLAGAWDVADDAQRLGDLIEYVLAFQSSAEIKLETLAQGDAFVKVTSDVWNCDFIEQLQLMSTKSCPYPVAVGVAARGHGIARLSTMTAYAHAYVGNLVSAVVRLVPLGQTDGQRITAALMAKVSAAVDKASATRFDEASTSTTMADILCMQHEIQYTRLFRS